MNRKIIIIGGGLAGLSAGIYGRMQGYDTHIFEMHKISGGVCTGWKRKGYTFDGAFHWWIGSQPESPFYKIFQQVGVFPETKPIQRRIFTVVKTGNGEFTVYKKALELKEEMLRVAPEDKPAIEDFIQLINDTGKMDMPMDKPMEAYSFIEMIKFLFKNGKMLKSMTSLMDTTIFEYTKIFNNSVLRDYMRKIFSPDLPLYALLITLSSFDMGDGTFPRGGALEFIEKINRKYRSLGGEISFGSRVKRILTEKKRAVGIELENGEVHKADWIISAADGYSTIYKMLEGKYTNGKIDRLYNHNKVFTPVIQVSLGVDADLSSYPHAFTLYDEKTSGGIPINGCTIRHYCYDPTLAPKGKSVVIVLMNTDYEKWSPLANDRRAYEAVKKVVTQTAIEYARSIYPGIEGKIEVSDTATPLTYIRYTNAWKASFEGWIPNAENLKTQIPKKLPGLRNFRMAGQWVEPGGGIPMAVMSGRNALYMISRADKRGWDY